MNPRIAARAVLPLVAAAMLLASGSAAAQYVQRRPVEARNPADPVYTRARVASVSEDKPGQWYVRLKLLPRAKVPFTTLTFRVLNQTLLTGIKPGDSVRFKADRQAHENTLLSIEHVAACPRFQKC